MTDPSRLVAGCACVCGEGVLWDPDRQRVWWFGMVTPDRLEPVAAY